ncbi:MAG: ABC transporter substrate-binding protein [Chloroflexota bacterium]|nr:ABC transporter substrate-binding protein [Chloroflexota bacterium]
MLRRNRQFEELIGEVRAGRVDRREFLKRAAAIGLSASTIGLALRAEAALAQEGSPAAGGAGETITSITTEEYLKNVREAFPFEEPQNQGGQVILGDSTDISTVNAMLAGDSPTFDVILGTVYETLYGSSVINGQPVPSGLANFWEIAPDGVTYTFHLNEDAVWHDGEPVTAEDVVFSFDAALNPETGTTYLTSNEAAIASYKAIDEHTFQLVAKDRLVTFLYDVFVPIMPKHIWENVPPAEWATDPGSIGTDPSRVIGSGPFKFVEWVQGDHVTLTKFDDYYADVPNIQEFIFRVLPDDAAAVQALRTGEVDIVDGVPPAQFEELEAAEGIEAEAYDTFSFTWYAYNLDPEKTTLFQDKEVRQALFYALDREAIVESILLGFGEVAQGTQPILSIAYAPDKLATRYDYNPERAQELLEQAGWVDTDGDGIREKNGQPLRFEAMTSEGAATNEQMIAYMQEAWREIGVDMQPVFVPFPTLLDAINETHDFDMVLLGFGWDPSGNQEAMFACASYEGSFNVMKYCNEQYDALNEQQKREFDQAARINLLIEQSNIINDDLPVGIVAFRQDRTAFSEALHNFFPIGLGLLWSLSYIWVEQS